MVEGAERGTGPPPPHFVRSPSPFRGGVYAPRLISYLIVHGLSRNRYPHPGFGPAAGAWAAVGEAGGVASAEEKGDSADAFAAGAGAGERTAFGLLGLRQCRYVRSVRRLFGPAARRQIALRRRGGLRSLGARPLAALSRPLPCPRRPAFGAGGGTARGS